MICRLNVFMLVCFSQCQLLNKTSNILGWKVNGWFWVWQMGTIEVGVYWVAQEEDANAGALSCEWRRSIDWPAHVWRQFWQVAADVTILLFLPTFLALNTSVTCPPTSSNLGTDFSRADLSQHNTGRTPLLFCSFCSYKATDIFVFTVQKYNELKITTF